VPARIAMLTGLLAVVAACSRVPHDRPETAPVSGLVTYQGQPLAGAEVRFYPPRAPRFAIATTDAEGRYTLSTFEPGDGAVLGEHLVAVLKPRVIPPAEPGMREDEAYHRAHEAAALAEQAGSAIPERYGDPATSGLTAVVKRGANEVNLALAD